jgi:formylglycine-generating enzyme required for sulfatase activity
MNKITTAMKLSLCALALGTNVAAQAQAPVITSFGGNGLLVCSNLAPGSVATVEWASSLSGPWNTNWAGLDAVAVDSNGMIQVSVPMFYRVRGTNGVPSGMALIPAGSFTMGDCMGDGNSAELPLHTVYVSGFYMDKYDVTKSLWDTVYNWAIAHGYTFDYAGSGKATTHPVQTIDWYDCVKWCNARSEKEGRVPAYYTDAGLSVRYRSGHVAPYVNWGTGYRLPTEAEWEKAARGGTSGQRFPWGNTISWSQANYYGDPGSLGGYAYDLATAIGVDPAFNDGVSPYTSPVGYFAANGYGLYDMAGNVWQSCWDWYGSYSSGSQSDPRGPASGSNRVLRGGGWRAYADFCRTAARGSLYPTFSDYAFGFRSVLPSGQ